MPVDLESPSDKWEWYRAESASAGGNTGGGFYLPVSFDLEFIINERGINYAEKWLKGMAAAAAAAVLAGAFAGCGGGQKSSGGDAKGQQTVKFGFVTAYTGPGAAYGQAMKDGVDLAVEEINNNPNTKMKIDLKTYDTKLVKAEAINAVKKCIEQDKVLAIEGPMTSGEMFAAGPIAQQSKVVAFGTGTTAPGITDIGDYIFRNAIPGKMAIPITVKKAQEKLGFKKVAILIPTTMTRW